MKRPAQGSSSTSRRTLFAFAFTALLIVVEEASPAPFAGPEFIMSNPVYVAAPYAQQNPSVCFNGSQFLVVWDDKRDQSSHIFGARVSTNGTILDPNSIKIDKTPGADAGAYYPVVASDGSSFLIVWTGSGQVTASARVLSSNGQLSDGFPSLGGYFTSECVAFNGSNYLLVWSTQGGDIYGSRVHPDGSLVDPAGIPICTAASSQFSPSVCALGTNWLVAWTDQRTDAGDIYGTLVSPDGTVLVSNGFPICVTNRTQTGPHLRSAGDKALVAWADARNSSLNDLTTVFATRISLLGQVLDGKGFQVNSGAAYHSVGMVASDGQNWLVTSCDQNIMSAQLISNQGVVQSTPLYRSEGLSAPGADYGGGCFLSAWQTRRGSASWMLDIQAQRISPSGTLLDSAPYTVSLANSTQMQPAVAGNGQDYLVAWSDERQGDGMWNIYATRLKGDGTVLDPDAIPITSLSTAETNPAVAFNGQLYLLVWSDTRASGFQGYVDVYGARVTTNGQVLDTNGFLIAHPLLTGTKAAVASVGTNFLVVWNGTSGSSSVCSGTRVTGDGQLLDNPGIQIFTGTGSGHALCLAANSSVYLVGWSANYAGDAILGSDGAILYSNYPISGFSLAGSNGRGFTGCSQGPYGVTGLVLNQSGGLGSVFQVASTYYNSAGYCEAFTGNPTDYLLLFSPAHFDSSSYIGNNGVYLSQITASGRAVYTNGLLAFTNSTVLVEMALGANPGNYLLAYTRPNDRRIQTLYGRILDSTPRLVNPFQNGGQFSFAIDGPAERNYEIQISQDLRSWSTAGSASNGLGTVSFSTNSPSPNAFYRAILR